MALIDITSIFSDRYSKRKCIKDTFLKMRTQQTSYSPDLFFLCVAYRQKVNFLVGLFYERQNKCHIISVGLSENIFANMRENVEQTNCICMAKVKKKTDKSSVVNWKCQRANLMISVMLSEINSMLMLYSLMFSR